MKNILRYGVCFPFIITGWPLLLLIRLLWGESTTVIDGVLVVRLMEGSLLTKIEGWGGITFGRAIMLWPHQEAVIPHEMQHVQQDEAFGAAGFVIGNVLVACGHPGWGLGLWAAMPLLVYGGGALVAWLRGGNVYRDNFLERAARDASGV